MSKGDTFENDLLKLIFNATAIADIADNDAAAATGDADAPDGRRGAVAGPGAGQRLPEPARLDQTLERPVLDFPALRVVRHAVLMSNHRA